MRSRFLVHVTGNTPHRIDHWTKPYLALPAAHSQATRLTHKWNGERAGDFKADIYRLDYPDHGVVWNAGATITLVETR